MVDSRVWSVDRLAANSLLAELKLEASAEMLELAAEHFARHRQRSHTWAAERAHSCVIRKLVSASTMYFDRKSEEWTDGFRSAEQQVITITPEELLETGPTKTRTKGQVLRALVRQAKSRL